MRAPCASDVPSAVSPKLIWWCAFASLKPADKPAMREISAAARSRRTLNRLARTFIAVVVSMCAMRLSIQVVCRRGGARCRAHWAGRRTNDVVAVRVRCIVLERDVVISWLESHIFTWQTEALVEVEVRSESKRGHRKEASSQQADGSG